MDALPSLVEDVCTMCYVPKKLRTKLDLRWRVRVCLGTADRSNEAYTGTGSGNVVKSRGISCVVQKSKWHEDSVLRVTGTPMQLCPNDLGNKEALWIESEIDPHAEPFGSGIDCEAAEVAEGHPSPPPPSLMKGAGRVRITRQDLVKYGFTKDCRRCANVEAGKHLMKETHSEVCRLRIYSDWESQKDPK